MSDTRTLHPQERIAVTLEARQWELIIALLHHVEARLRDTLPLVQSITAQCVRPRTAELHELRPATEGESRE